MSLYAVPFLHETVRSVLTNNVRYTRVNCYLILLGREQFVLYTVLKKTLFSDKEKV